MKHYFFAFLCMSIFTIALGASREKKESKKEKRENKISGIHASSSSSSSPQSKFVYRKPKTFNEKMLVQLCYDCITAHPIQYYLEQGTNPNLCGEGLPIVVHCTANNNSETVDLLIKHGLHKDPELVVYASERLLSADENGIIEKPFNIENRLAILDALIAHNHPWNPNTRGFNGRTALMSAAGTHPQLVTRLLEHVGNNSEANLALQDDKGMTALIHCIDRANTRKNNNVFGYYGNKDCVYENVQFNESFQEYTIVQQLIAAKADPAGPDSSGHKPLDYATNSQVRYCLARSEQYPKILALLKTTKLNTEVHLPPIVMEYLNKDYEKMEESDFPKEILPPIGEVEERVAKTIAAEKEAASQKHGCCTCVIA